jgi:hypothetical protein
MKKVFLYIIALLPLITLAQEPEQFEVKSNVGHLNAPARAYLLYQVGANRVMDSAQITNGSFDFKGKILNPVGAFIVIDPTSVGLDRLDSTADFLSFYIDKGVIQINSPDSLSKAKITGSKINDTIKNY